jgi:hypothetical protein
LDKVATSSSPAPATARSSSKVTQGRMIVREFLHRNDAVLQRVTLPNTGGIFREWSHLRTRHHRYFSVEPG